MKGDVTRRTFDPAKHYRSVLQQQGRVQLDADWNEQLDIQDHLDRTTTTDVVGGHGGPVGHAGFGISVDGTGKLVLGAGRYYVAGVLLENDAPVLVAAQPDLPGVALPTADGRYAAYLDVWTEHVTALEDPHLREVALGGPDTTTRGRTIWQARLATVAAGASCGDFGPGWAPPHSAGTGRLRAQAQAPTASPSPCVIPATAGYRRLENQLYRVEIHDDSAAAGGPTYVWSRENGSVAVRLTGVDATTIHIDAPGRDERLGFAKNDLVEVIDVARVRRGGPGFLAVLDDASGTKLTVARWIGTAPAAADLGETTVVRRWDSGEPIPVVPGWAPLEDGIEIDFAAGGEFRTGDYWLIPARTANLQGVQLDPDLAGDVDWPRAGGQAVYRERAGITHDFAVIGLLDLTAGKWTAASDCRRIFAPLTALIDLEYAGGDGQETLPGGHLPEPLQVTVTDTVGPVAGALVEFSADAGGHLAVTEAGLGAGGTPLQVPTDGDGIAACFWQPAGAPAHQRVRATLVGHDVAPVDFFSRFSTADQVSYDPGTCRLLQGAVTVQTAIERITGARSLAAVGGDGQDGDPGTALPLPVSVLVRSDCGPIPKATVTFSVAAGSVGAEPGDLGAAQSIPVTADPDGFANCFWQLGPASGPQVLTATLVADGAATTGPTTLAFTANARPPSAKGRPGLHVTGVILLNGNIPLRNDAVFEARSFLEGFDVVLDGEPMPELVNGKPVVSLTVDLPYPMFGDRQFWGDQLIGTQPLTLGAAVQLAKSPKGPAIRWSPTGQTRDFLLRVFNVLAEFKAGDRVLCHVRLLGRAVADSREKDRRVINGLSLGILAADGRTDFPLPTSDEVVGADLELWFTMVQSLLNLTVVPARSGLLRLKTVRDAIGAAVPRDQLTARLPAGIHVTPGTLDPDAARRAADRAFRDRPERRLVFIVDERFTDAATVIEQALAGVDVTVETIPAADPAAAARERAAAGEPLDGVITSGDAVDAVAALDGFGEGFAL